MKINMHLEMISPAFHGNKLYILEIDDGIEEVETHFSIKNVQVQLSKQELLMVAKAFKDAANRM